MLTLSEVKRWLRLEEEFTDEDDLLQTLMHAAQEYITNATGRNDWGDNPLAKLLAQVLIADWYENREAMGRVREEMRLTVRSILTQLQYSYPETTEDGEGA